MSETNAPNDEAPRREADREASRRAWRRRWRWIALASLALNVFLVGIFVGGGLRPDKRRRPDRGDERSAPPRPFTARGAERALQGDARGTVEEVRATHAEAIQTSLDELGAAIDAATQATTREPWDPAAAEAALADLRRANDAFQTALHAEYVDLLNHLSPAQRAELIEAQGELREKLRRRGPKRANPHRGRNKGERGPP